VIKKTYTTLAIVILVFTARYTFAWDFISGGDHSNTDWIVSSSTQIAGNHFNIKTFTLIKGATLHIKDFDGVHYGSVTINAVTININGMLDGNGKGYPGGIGGVAQSTIAYCGHAGTNGNPGASGGIAGEVGRSSWTVSGSGAGGGGGGSYGGTGDNGNSGGFNKLLLPGGAGGNSGIIKGAETGQDIDMGSGGAGSGGGGAGGPQNRPGGGGGNGGAGGGCVKLIANYITIKGTITVNGSDGAAGGNGGGTLGVPATNGGGGGGGAGAGSGGGILIYGNNSVVILSSAVITAGGGSGGCGGGSGISAGGAGDMGGSGGGGRIKIFYGNLAEAGLVQSEGGDYLGSIGDDGTVYRKCLIAPVIIGIFPGEDAYSIPVSSHIVILFNQQMDETSTESAISIYPIRDNLYNSISTCPVYGDGSFITSGDVHKLVFTPSENLKYNYVYEVRLSTVAEGILNNHISAEKTWTFRTRLDSARDNRLVTEDGKANVYIDSGTLPSDSYLSINDAGSGVVATADAKLEVDSKLQRIGQAMEFNAFDGSGNEIGALFTGVVNITFSYDDVNQDGFVDGSDPLVDERYMALYWLDESNDLWVKLDNSSVDTASNTVTAQPAHFTVFSLIGAANGEVASAYAFPVPYCPNDDDVNNGTSAGGITFKDLASECAINIYTVTGELVNSIDVVPGDMNIKNWDVKNIQGQDVFSGVYVYCIESGISVKKGKLVVIR